MKNKYVFYQKSVQSPELDLKWLLKVYKDKRKKTPYHLGEDFCGSFLLSYHWVKKHPKNQTYSVDLSKEPLEFGLKNHFLKLNEDEKKRLHLQRKNVLSIKKTSYLDLLIVFNFSYYIIKDRKTLKAYFKNSLKRLKKDGLFVIDAFGGPGSLEANMERVNHRSFFYYWEQKNYDYVKNEAQFYIHFKEKNKKIKKRVFKYDWRLWGVSELRDLLMEVGFKKVDVYAQKGKSENFSLLQSSNEELDFWMLYLVCQK